MVNEETTAVGVEGEINSRHATEIELGKVNDVASIKPIWNTSLTGPGACLRGMDISMDCGSLQYRERREVQWINCYNTTNDKIQDWKLSNLSLPNLMEPYETNRARRNEVLLYVLSGILLLLAIAFGWHYASPHFDYIRQ